MIIKKEQICCGKIRDSIDRYSHLIRMFIRQVNKQMPDGMKFNKETFFVERIKSGGLYYKENSYRGYKYRIIWAYTPREKKINDKNILILQQKNTIYFVYECYERICDHTKSSLQILSLYCKTKDATDLAEMMNYIYDNSREFFDKFDIMQVVDKML